MKKLFPFLLLFVIAISGCKKDDTPTPQVTLPSSYNFENVEFTEQTSLIGMLQEIAAELRKGLTQEVTADRMHNLYTNSGSPFTNPDLNTEEANLRDETFAADATLFDSYFDRFAAATALRGNTVTGAGQAGTAISITDNTKKYLVDSNGVEYTQVIQKGLMGAVFYYRICEDETAVSTLNASDNNTVRPGKGTEMQHEWDEAFGYWGVPVSLTAATFDSLNTAKKLFYYGTYAEKTKSIGGVEKLLNAFIKGRDAINRKDYVTRDIAGTEVRKYMELINACSYISYLNQGITGFNDYAIRCHVLSEGFGFFSALQYNSSKLISTADFNDIKSKYFVSGKLSIAHLTVEEITQIRDRISNIYGLNSVKTTL